MRLAEEALSETRANGDDAGVGMALFHLANAIGDREGIGAVEALFNDAIALLTAADDIDAESEAAAAFHNLATAASLRGDFDRAEILAAQALDRWQALKSGWGTAGTLCLLAANACEFGDYDRAATLGKQALSLHWDLRDLLNMIDSLMVIAEIAVHCAQPIMAARLWGAAEALSEEIGIVLPVEIKARRRVEAGVMRAELGDEAFAAERSAGRALPLEQAVEEALAFVPTPPGSSAPGSHHRLTSREVEVLNLVAEGRTDREIADVLFISRRTVNAHVTHILTKLEVSTRREAVAKAIEFGLLTTRH